MGMEYEKVVRLKKEAHEMVLELRKHDRFWSEDLIAHREPEYREMRARERASIERQLEEVRSALRDSWQQ